ncbi:TonB-dependent siderophore receptor [Pollutimonas nitritireducens]|uniref:TonB-dependent siderophore receptor n=1 Tax=Pollutimonas nitritireducens TaxID=2045209 RepID=A0A2N4UGS7_9BURK|nr:TonB-dependent receptor [Pollutimonas nitritireducens]PLC54221.1 TonB-dependent siderophore receptor [Pollutimonas nitritireducens]
MRRPYSRLTILAASVLSATSPVLAQQPPETLAPIIVQTTRTDATLLETPASVSIIDGDSMRQGKLQVNLSESLGSVPGLQIQNRQNYAQDLQISIRGFGARSAFGVRGLRLYVDGIPATMPDGQGQTSNIDISSIDRVEILRGPFSALYGNSSGGVIQVFSEDGSSPATLSAGLAAGSYGTYRYSAKAKGLAELGSTELDYVLSTSRYTTQGYRDHSGTRKNLGNMKLGLQFSDDSRLTLIGNSVDIKADDPLGLGRSAFENDPRSVHTGAIDYNTRKTVRQTQGGLIYDQRINTNHELRAMVYFGQRKTTQYQAIPFFAQTSSANPLHAGGLIDLKREYGGADLRWTSKLAFAGKPLTLVGGMAYDEMTEQRKGYFNFVNAPAGRQLGVQGDLRRNETNKSWNLDPYLQASWQFAEQWTLDAGLRYSTVDFSSNDHYITQINNDGSGDARYQKALPIVSLRYAATPDFSLYASAGRGFETPTFNEISYRSGGLAGLNFGLQPSVNTSVELGAKVQTKAGLITAALFQTRTEDEIVTAESIGGRTVYQNAGGTRRNGFELGWTGKFLHNWRSDLAYTWLDAEYRDDCVAPACSSAIHAGNKIPGIARQAAYAAVGWAPPTGWRAGLEARYLSDIQVNDANSETTPAYFVAAISAGYLWRTGPWEVSTFARLDNLFDRHYAGSVIVNEGNQRYYEPAPGRHWTAGTNISYSF